MARNVNKWGEIKWFANLPGSKIFPDASSAQVASSNQVLTSMCWGVPGGGGGLVSSLTGRRPPWAALEGNGGWRGVQERLQ